MRLLLLLCVLFVITCPSSRGNQNSTLWVCFTFSLVSNSTQPTLKTQQKKFDSFSPCFSQFPNLMICDDLSGFSIQTRLALNIEVLSILHFCNAAPVDFAHIWDNIIRYIYWLVLHHHSRKIQIWNWIPRFPLFPDFAFNSIKPLTGPSPRLKRPLRTLQIAANQLRASQGKWGVSKKKINAFQVAHGRWTHSSKLNRKETLPITGQSGGSRISQTKTPSLNFTMLQWCPKIWAASRAVLPSIQTTWTFCPKSKKNAVKLDLIVR